MLVLASFGKGFLIKLFNLIEKRKHKPIYYMDCSEAYALVRKNCNFNVFAERLNNELKLLFKVKFENKYSEQGVKISNKNADVLLQDFIKITSEAAGQLKSYSWSIENGNRSTDLVSILLLPNEIKELIGKNQILKFEDWMNELIIKKSGKISFKEFWDQLSSLCPKEISDDDLNMLRNVTSTFGFSFVPEPKVHFIKPRVDSNIVIFKNKFDRFEVPSKIFNKVLITLWIGSVVAQIDNKVTHLQKRTLQDLITNNDLLPTEKESLNAYLIWRFNEPVNFKGIKDVIKILQEDEICFVRDFIILLALVDGDVNSIKINCLEQIYEILGLDKQFLLGHFHNTTVNKGTGSTNDKLARIASASASSFKLDHAILAMCEDETEKAKSMLESIFQDDFEKETIVEDKQDSRFIGLDKAHNALFNKLIQKTEWERSEFQEACQVLGLMVEGAIEVINDWAYDIIDAPVIDDNINIYIDLDLVNELKG